MLFLFLVFIGAHEGTNQGEFFRVFCEERLQPRLDAKKTMGWMVLEASFLDEEEAEETSPASRS
jgi:hypothetical protein